MISRHKHIYSNDCLVVFESLPLDGDGNFGSNSVTRNEGHRPGFRAHLSRLVDLSGGGGVEQLVHVPDIFAQHLES